MSYTALSCPACGADVKQYRNPLPAVDIIIEIDNKIVLIERKNPPFGWALPGGFVEYGESLEDAAVREAREETCLEVKNLQLVGCYSDPRRDDRMHIISTVYAGRSFGVPHAADDAVHCALFTLQSLPEPLCFDHARILADYAIWKSRQ